MQTPPFNIFGNFFLEINGNIAKPTKAEGSETRTRSFSRDQSPEPPSPVKFSAGHHSMHTSPASATLASVQAALAALQAGQMSLNQVGDNLYSTLQFNVAIIIT